VRREFPCTWHRWDYYVRQIWVRWLCELEWEVNVIISYVGPVAGAGEDWWQQRAGKQRNGPFLCEKMLIGDLVEEESGDKCLASCMLDRHVARKRHFVSLLGFHNFLWKSFYSSNLVRKTFSTLCAHFMSSLVMSIFNSYFRMILFYSISWRKPIFIFPCARQILHFEIEVEWDVGADCEKASSSALGIFVSSKKYHSWISSLSHFEYYQINI